MKKKVNDPEWSEMSNIQRAEYCEKIADGYNDGFCKDQVLSQARQLREKAGREQATKDAEGA